MSQKSIVALLCLVSCSVLAVIYKFTWDWKYIYFFSSTNILNLVITSMLVVYTVGKNIYNIINDENKVLFDLKTKMVSNNELDLAKKDDIIFNIAKLKAQIALVKNSIDNKDLNQSNLYSKSLVQQLEYSSNDYSNVNEDGYSYVKKRTK